jgi:hypothetical protein
MTTSLVLCLLALSLALAPLCAAAGAAGSPCGDHHAGLAVRAPHPPASTFVELLAVTDAHPGAARGARSPSADRAGSALEAPDREAVSVLRI